MPLSIGELKQASINYDINTQLIYGFYPRIYKYDLKPQRFYRDYVQTYVERDIKLLINIKDLDQFQRFLMLCAGRVGQIIDYTNMANDLGISRHTVKEWISILKASFIITTLPPYFEIFGKRIIKSPKLYFNDVGLACYLLGIREAEQVALHPMRGALFENLIVNEVSKIHYNCGEEQRLYFYRDSNQLEVDLIFQQGLKLIAIEIKSSKTFNKEFIKDISNFKALAKKHDVEAFVIYSGEHQQTVQDYQIINYQQLDDNLM